MKLCRYIRKERCFRPLTALAAGSGIGAAAGLNALPWWCMLFLFVPALFLTGRGRILLAAGFIIAGSTGFLSFRRSCELEKKLPRRPFIANGVFVCTDTRLSKLPDLDMPKQLRGTLTLPDTGTLPVTATFPAESPRPFYGDSFSVEGQLYPPSPSALTADAEGRITGTNEPPFGKVFRFRVQKAEFSRSEHGLRRALLLWRDILLKRLLAHLDGTLVRSQTARLFLGASAGAPAEVRNRYVSAGTIHLFAVSGMHVAVLAGVLLFLLRPLPFRIRCSAGAALIWIYVFCTGGAYSAIRAGAMISAWLLCRAMLLYSPGWNILCLGWSLILWFDPRAVTDLGVLYSFAITAALILGSERFRDLYRAAEAPKQLMTEHNIETERFHRALRRSAKLLALPFSAGTAFTASCGISLWAQSLFAPGGIAANLLLPLLTPLLFIAIAGKMAFGWITPLFDRIGAALISLIFTLLDQLCMIVVMLFGRIGAVRPELWEIGVFYAAFFLALGSRRFLPALFCGSTAMFLLISWPLRAAFHPEEVWVLSPGKGRPAMVVQIPRGSARTLILNAPDFNCGITASQELRRSGVTEVEVWLDSGTVAAGSGLVALRSGGLRIVRLHLPERRSPAFQAVIDRSSPEQLICEKHSSFAAFSGLTAEDHPADSGRHIRIFSADREYCDVTLPWSFPPVWRRIRPQSRSSYSKSGENAVHFFPPEKVFLKKSATGVAKLFPASAP